MKRLRSLVVVSSAVFLVVVLLVARTVPATEKLDKVVTSAGGRDRPTLAELQRDLRAPSREIRARAAQALAQFEHRAVLALTSALNDNEYKVRSTAAETLVKIGPGPVVPRMIEALRSSEVPIRANAAVVLGAFGPAAKAAIPALARALKDANPRVRELAGEALNRIMATGPSDPVSFPLNCH